MQNVILVIHILACLAMIGLVLVQKSEGGGLGIGGGGANSLMSGRGAAGAIVRTTIIIGGIFFATSLALTSIANRNSDNRSGIEKALEETAPAGASGDPVDLFDPSVSLVESDPAPASTSDTPVVTAPQADATAVEVPLPPTPETAPETAPTETNPQ
ncbi:preprotein translocase subunit SecG [Hyphomonas sp.]|uniref:preprotein translocase subunit SecG n=1 Tax=Hyphomonas sp. TaxID=87 RepID=UPI0025BCDCA9|nr:preprotein translocase subunit SecG [Hyphomonas sp.]MBI1400668.1 preprotein translocase subunit SecG [Hyphomonas sp.]